MKIMKTTTVIVVILIVWCLVTLVKHPAPLPPSPLRPGVFHLTHESLGWLYGSWVTKLTSIILLLGFGHSVLSMSGEEAPAQVNREIEHPKLKNLGKNRSGDLHL